MIYQPNKPVTLTVESERGKTVYKNAYFGGIASTGSLGTIEFHVSGGTFTPSEPPVGSAVKVDDGRIFIRHTKAAWKSVDGSDLRWESVLDKNPDVIYWNEK